MATGAKPPRKTIRKSQVRRAKTRVPAIRSALAKLEANADKYGLTLMQRRFVEEYFKAGKPKESAIAAGFAPKSAAVKASQLLQLEGIQAYLRDLRIREMETAGITKHDWLKEQKAIGFSNILDFLTFGPDGVQLKDSSELTPEQARVIAEVKETITQTGSSVSFKMHDKQKALDSIGKHFAWLKETPCDPKNVKPLVIINRVEIVEKSAGPTPIPIIEIGS